MKTEELKRKLIKEELERAKNEIEKLKECDQAMNKKIFTVQEQIKSLDLALKIYEMVFNAFPFNWNLIDYTFTTFSDLSLKKPLTPICGDEGEWVNIDNRIIKENVIHKWMNKRCPDLFKEELNDHTIVYRDNIRCLCYDYIIEREYYFGLGNKIYDSVVPISMPYDVDKERGARLYIHSFLSDPSKRPFKDFDTVVVLMAQKPDGTNIKINRYFKECISNVDDKNNWYEIDFEELKNRVESSKSNLSIEDLRLNWFEDDLKTNGISENEKNDILSDAT